MGTAFYVNGAADSLEAVSFYVNGAAPSFEGTAFLYRKWVCRNFSHPFAAITMSSLKMVEYLNEIRKEEGEPKLEHPDFMRKVPLVLGEEAAAELSATAFYIVNGAKREQKIYNFPKREATLMAMSFSYALQAKVFDLNAYINAYT